MSTSALGDRPTWSRPDLSCDSLEGMAEDALKTARNNMKLAVQIYRDELWQLKAEHAHLRSQYDHLRERHEALKETHSIQSEAWKRFKVWWMGKIDKKLANITQSTAPARGSDDNDNIPFASTSSPSLAKINGMTPDTSSRKRPKLKCTEEEKVILRNVGLDCYIESTPVAQKTREDVKVEDGGVERGMRITSLIASSSASSPPSSIKRPARREMTASDGAIPISSKSGSKRRMSESVDEEVGPRRQGTLMDIGNTSGSRSPPATTTTTTTTMIKQEVLESSPPQTNSARSQVGKEVPRAEQPSSKPQKGRGRYSTGSSRTINGEYEINPEQNGNVPFLHKSVVRDKTARRQMHAHDCACCSEYYECVGEAPLRKYQDPRTMQNFSRSEGAVDNTVKQQQHRQQISRHRDYGPPASTPPHYWDVSFPSTQMQEQVNEMARREHQKRKEQMAKDPRFRKRAAADG